MNQTLIENDLDEIQVRRGARDAFLSDEDFRGKYGEPPWEAMTELMSAMNLPFEVVAPSNDMNSPCQFTLRVPGSNRPLRFEDISSGEQVLVRFALSIMSPRPYILGLQRPHLLLLDEMDAALHPEMVQRWLGALKSGIVDDLGIKVILTTHSPTTVALAPSNSIFEMSEYLPVSIGKQAALNKLTIGVPTLSIDYSGQRQVFVESDTDAQAYNMIYRSIKGSISLQKELNFISTGMRIKKEETNTGSALVKKIVKSLTKLGNKSTFGLIDWDKKYRPTDRVHVIGYKTYYTLENIIFDPLIFGLFMIANNLGPWNDRKFVEDFEKKSHDDLQLIADIVQNAVEFPHNNTKLSEISYIGGAKINVKKCYLEINGHELENKLCDTFSLDKYKLNKGLMKKDVIKTVIVNHPNFCPNAIKSAFENLSIAVIDETK